jgi:hypothetical protein
MWSFNLPKIGVASQTCWLGGRPCHKVIGIVDASSGLTQGKNLNNKKVFILICTIAPISSIIGYIPTTNQLL